MKTLLAASRLLIARFASMFQKKTNAADKLAQEQEAERLDRIRNPHKYRPAGLE